VPAEAKTITFSVGGGAVEFDFWEQLMRDFHAETGIAMPRRGSTSSSCASPWTRGCIARA
jgi:hypothetical protein